MNELAEVVQKWSEYRELAIEEPFRKIVQEAQKLLEEWLSEEKYDIKLHIFYRHENFRIQIIEGSEVCIIKEAEVPFVEIKKVSVILQKIIREFENFPQLNVTKVPFAQNPQSMILSTP